MNKAEMNDFLKFWMLYNQGKWLKVYEMLGIPVGATVVPIR